MSRVTSSSTFELHNVSSPEGEIDNTRALEMQAEADMQNVLTQSLPRCDGGKAAWTLLLAMFLFEALLWGFPLSFGVFQNHYSQLPQFRDSPYISAVGTTATGIIYIAAPVIIPFIRRYSKYRRHMILIGWPICLLGLIAGSFAKTLPTLVLTQGVVYGIGFVTFYYPILSMVNEFWIARRGMAYGILCSASGVSGTTIPFCVATLLSKYGYPTTLRLIAAGLFVTTGPMIPFLKGRLPESESASAGRTDWSFLRRPLFWIYSASNLAMGLGYFLPSLYLPSYASSIGGSATDGAVLLALMSVAQVLGQMSFGYLSDRNNAAVSLNALLLLSTAAAGVATWTCWGLGRTFGVLAAFALVYGFFGAGYTAMWARMGTAVSGGEPTAAFASFGLLNLGKGVGNVLAGMVSGVLLVGGVDVDSYGAARYKAMVIFTGSCMFLSAAIVPLSYVRR